MRRLLAWLVCVPIIAAASQVAHGASYRLVTPDPAARAELLEHTGHSYLSAISFALAVGWAAVLIGFGALALQAARGRVSARPSATPFALLGPITFVLQEHLERLIHDGAFPFAAVFEPTFGIGLALQLPFALVAFLVARALLRVAECLGRILCPERRARHAAGNTSLPRPTVRHPFRPFHLNAALGIVRGPPAPLLV